MLMVIASAGSAFAAECTEDIKAVQSEVDKVLVLFASNNTWHVIADGASTSVRSDRLSLAVTAKLSGKRLYLSYAGSSCTTTDYGTVANKVRLVD